MTGTDSHGVSLRLLGLMTLHLHRARLFYEAVGIRLVEERHGGGPVHYSGQVGVTTIEVYPWPEDGPILDTSVRLGFEVDDLGRVLGSLKRVGAPVVTEPRMTPWGYRAVVKDPDGRAVEVYGREGRA